MRSSESGGARSAALALGLAALVASLGCGASGAGGARGTAPAPAGLAPGGPSASLHEERTRNLAWLHPSARRLIAEQHREADWARDASIAISPAHCAEAVQWPEAARSGCTLLAIGRGRAAVLVVRDEAGCASAACLERSWVYLRAHARPLPLPTRRLEDYRLLSAELSSERATTLWLAGFRAYDEPRLALVDAPSEREDVPVQVASYESCTLGPHEHELLCPGSAGRVIAIDPVHGSQRVVRATP